MAARIEPGAGVTVPTRTSLRNANLGSNSWIAQRASAIAKMPGRFPGEQDAVGQHRHQSLAELNVRARCQPAGPYTSPAGVSLLPLRTPVGVVSWAHHPPHPVSEEA